MKKSQIDQIIENGYLPFPSDRISLIETHISWLIIGEKYVYKIKKPVKLSFLDFSTLELRKFFCERELVLNRRFSPEMYLDVLPVQEIDNKIFIGKVGGIVKDYAVRMKKMDRTRQLDVLLKNGKVKLEDINKLAEVIAAFHHQAEVIPEGEDWKKLYHEFADLKSVSTILVQNYGKDVGDLITELCDQCYAFLYNMRGRIDERNKMGLVIDGHGDLHTRNIFLLDKPVLFDCIEFNDDFRKLDVLSEIAFLSIDLERFGRRDLSEILLRSYCNQYPAIENHPDEQLFHFYKIYRVNVMIKVHAIRLKEILSNGMDENYEKKLVRKYIDLMQDYMKNGFSTLNKALLP